MPGKDPIFGGSAKYPAGDPKRQGAPKPGSYSSGPFETAANSLQAIPGSKSPSTYGKSSQAPDNLSSANLGPRGPFEGTSDNAYAVDLLKSFNPKSNTKPDLMR